MSRRFDEAATDSWVLATINFPYTPEFKGVLLPYSDETPYPTPPVRDFVDATRAYVDVLTTIRHYPLRYDKQVLARTRNSPDARLRQPMNGMIENPKLWSDLDLVKETLLVHERRFRRK